VFQTLLSRVLNEQKVLERRSKSAAPFVLTDEASTTLSACLYVMSLDRGQICRQQLFINKLTPWRMPSSDKLRRMALVITDVSEKRSASIIAVARIGVLGTALAVTNNRRMLQRNTPVSVARYG
jgi:uncharacterized membrane protein YqhA